MLDPATLDGIRDLRLFARTVIEGFLAGLHLDARSGAGVEFSRYRAYQPGDDPRLIDWKVWGRSDRYVVREAERERDVTVRLLLDVSKSMDHRDGERVKIDVARRLAAALAFLADAQGDRVALHLLGSERSLTQANAGRGLRSVFASLEAIQPAGSFPEADDLFAVWPKRRGREIVVLISDLHEIGEEMQRLLKALRTRRHEVLIFHLLGRNELEFTWQGDLEFEDLETGRTVRAEASSLRDDYLRRLSDELAEQRRRSLDLGAAYGVVALDESIDTALREFLERRRRLP